jgi:hypothetical protein
MESKEGEMGGTRRVVSQPRGPSGFPTNILEALLIAPMRVICPAHLSLFSLVTISLVKSTNYEFPHCTIVCGLLPLPPFGSKSPQHPALNLPLYRSINS